MVRNAYFYSSPLIFCPMPLGPTTLKAKDPQIRGRCLGSNPSPIHKDPKDLWELFQMYLDGKF
jgi:hypothetical protein